MVANGVAPVAYEWCRIADNERFFVTATPPPLQPENLHTQLPAGTNPRVRQPWWLGCHGGAGTSTTQTLAGIGIDCGTYIGHRNWTQDEAGIVLVCRSTAAGTAAAMHVLGYCDDPDHPSPPLLGVAVIADCARKPPKVVTERLKIWRGSMSVWHLDFIEALRSVSDPREVGRPPQYAAMAAELASFLSPPVSAAEPVHA